jgi:S-adenosylmethionine:tRNA ribosyltransferase-isomerase
MRFADFDYELPAELVAQEPCADRDGARLLVHERATGRTAHTIVRQVDEWLRPGDLLVVNDTRVLAARLFAVRSSGGRVELLLLEPQENAGRAWSALVRPARRLRPGEPLTIEGTAGPKVVRLLERVTDPSSEADGGAGRAWRVAFEDPAGQELDALAVLAEAGHVPLPPYVTRADRDVDHERYQTVWAARPGAVAAPTAGLHFTPELLERLERRGIRRTSVTLHVGLGTFAPVEVEELDRHVMHSERYELSSAAAQAVAETRASGGRVVAIGTTSARVLESCVDEDGRLRAGAGRTELFLRPGARFRAVDALFTNFHLPRSTLLCLVAAFAGRERVLELYREAVAREYRFFSYGDAMLVL